MRLLLHSCCADCVLRFIGAIRNDTAMSNVEIVLYYYNPNIHPHSEFTARQIALQKIASENYLKLIIQNWTPKDYFDSVMGWKLKSDRCPKCWQLRLEKTFFYAKDNGFDIISTTLISSIYHQKGIIIEIGEKLSKEFKIKFFVPSKIDPELKTSGFYKQNYCGCVYSLKERMEEKYKG